MKKKFKISSTDIITFFTIFILSSSIFGLYNFKEGENSQELPDYVFEYISNSNNVTYYFEDIDNNFLVYLPLSNGQYYKAGYRLDPREITNYAYPNEVINKINSNKKIYLSANPNNLDGKVNVAMLQLVNSISLSTLGRDVDFVESFTEDANPINPNIPIRSCKSNDFVIEFNLAKNNGVFIKNNCIQINSTTSDNLINYADSIGYGLVGIN